MTLKTISELLFYSLVWFSVSPIVWGILIPARFFSKPVNVSQAIYQIYLVMFLPVCVAVFIVWSAAN